VNWKVLGIFFFPAVGCAAYEPQPLSLQHPANASAAPTPDQPPSQTLAYRRADLPQAMAAAALRKTLSEKERSLRPCRAPVNSLSNTARSKISWSR
jgi:hypothetical protein